MFEQQPCVYFSSLSNRCGLGEPGSSSAGLVQFRRLVRDHGSQFPCFGTDGSVHGSRHARLRSSRQDECFPRFHFGPSGETRSCDPKSSPCTAAYHATAAELLPLRSGGSLAIDSRSNGPCVIGNETIWARLSISASAVRRTLLLLIIFFFVRPLLPSPLIFQLFN